jgi:thiol-disulfide isomerase/thioredoxin
MALALALAGGVTTMHEEAAVAQAGGRASPAGPQAGKREPAWLGVELDTTRSEAKGVRIRHTIRSSPGWAAGIRDGDVILRVDDVATLRPDDVIRAVSAHAPGDVVRIAVLRAGTESAMSATLGSLPDSDEVLRLDKVGAPAPTWKDLSAVSGPLPGAINDLRGRVVIVDFWATWCMACRMATPKLTSWQAKFGAQGLSVIGITDDPVPEASQGAQSFGMKYAAIATDTSYSTQRAFGVRALPTVFLIDKRGVIRDVSVGFDPRKEAQMEALMLRLLAEPAP